MCFSCYFPHAFLPGVTDVETIVLLTGTDIKRSFDPVHCYIPLTTKWISILMNTNYSWRRRRQPTKDEYFTSQFSHSVDTFISWYLDSLREVDGNRTHYYNKNKIDIQTQIIAVDIFLK